MANEGKPANYDEVQRGEKREAERVRRRQEAYAGIEAELEKVENEEAEADAKKAAKPVKPEPTKPAAAPTRTVAATPTPATRTQPASKR